MHCFHAIHGLEYFVSSTLRYYWIRFIMHIRVGYEFIYNCPNRRL